MSERRPVPLDIDNFIHAAELAEHLGISERSLVRFRGIPYVDLGGVRLYDRVGVAEWLIERGQRQRQNRRLGSS